MLFSKTGSFISPFTQKLISATRLFKWCCVTVWLPVTTTSCSNSYANLLWGTGFAFCCDICRIIDQCSTDFPKKWNGKINFRIHIVQGCLRLAGTCNETVYIPMRKHWSGRRLQWIKQNTIHILKKYIFFLILTEDDQGWFEVSKKSSLAMQTPNCLHSVT